MKASAGKQKRAETRARTYKNQHHWFNNNNNERNPAPFEIEKDGKWCAVHASEVCVCARNVCVSGSTLYKWQFAHSPFWVTFSLFWVHLCRRRRRSCRRLGPGLWIYRLYCRSWMMRIFSLSVLSFSFFACVPRARTAAARTRRVCNYLFMYTNDWTCFYPVSIDLFATQAGSRSSPSVFVSFDAFIVFDFMCTASVGHRTRNETEKKSSSFFL